MGWDGTAHICISHETQKQNESVRMLLSCHTYTILLNFKVNKFCRLHVSFYMLSYLVDTKPKLS